MVCGITISIGHGIAFLTGFYAGYGLLTGAVFDDILGEICLLDNGVSLISIGHFVHDGIFRHDTGYIVAYRVSNLVGGFVFDFLSSQSPFAGDIRGLISSVSFGDIAADFFGEGTLYGMFFISTYRGFEVTAHCVGHISGSIINQVFCFQGNGALFCRSTDILGILFNGGGGICTFDSIQNLRCFLLDGGGICAIFYHNGIGSRILFSAAGICTAIGNGGGGGSRSLGIGILCFSIFTGDDFGNIIFGNVSFHSPFIRGSYALEGFAVAGSGLGRFALAGLILYPGILAIFIKGGGACLDDMVRCISFQVDGSYISFVNFRVIIRLVTENNIVYVQSPFDFDVCIESGLVFEFRSGIESGCPFEFRSGPYFEASRGGLAGHFSRSSGNFAGECAIHATYIALSRNISRCRNIFTTDIALRCDITCS